MPYQCITERGNLLVAARDSNIDLFNLEDGSHLSTWAFPSSEKVQDPKSVVEEQPKTLATQESQSSSVDIIINSNSPPAKRRKLSSGEAEKQETPIKESEQELASNSNVTVQKNGINGKQQKKQKQNNRSVAISTGLEPPAIIALTVSDDEKHVVAVTGEDKCIRVFEVVNEEEKVKLVQISERVMAKRPSSIAISRDSTTILSADKFGDVYSLPLLQAQSKDPETRSSTPTVDKPFKPSANELTIHSQRNRIALENQKRHHNSAPKNQLPTFEHTLLLGHVSLLIDLKLVTLEEKTYIITADRDEHIRVSRGIPQAHIIEGFCLGHREFVSKLCVPKPRPEVLVSGGGDDELFLWNWRISMLLCKVDLREQARKILGNEEKDRKIAVSGIYDIRHDGVDLILVTIEAIPGVIIFRLAGFTLSHKQTLSLPGNVLSVATTSCRVIISIDIIHAPGSITELSATDKPASSLFTYKFNNAMLDKDTSFRIAGIKDNDIVDVDSAENKRMTNLLYSVENLRKRVGDIDGAEAEAEQA